MFLGLKNNAYFCCAKNTDSNQFLQNGLKFWSNSIEFTISKNIGLRNRLF